jgi:epoxyqueuosine reductase
MSLRQAQAGPADAGFSERLRSRALELGFDLVGVAPALPPGEHVQAYRDWLARQEHGEMAYMARPDRVLRREDPSLVLPGARSVVCVAVNYAAESSTAPVADLRRGRVSSYAWGSDYHDWLLPRLEDLASFVRVEVGGEVHHRAYVDTGPVLERAFAARAGLGFVGKNTCLIHPRLGSWLFLGEVLVDVDLSPLGEPLPPRCGTCVRCLEACPSGALVAPYRLDARRCISYLTIELKGPIPHDLRPLLGDHVYGCDVCQDVCPWQRFARPSTVPAFRARSPDRAAPLLLDLLALDEERFRRRFEGSPVLRVGRARLLRNVAVVLGNTGARWALPALVAALGDAESLVRGHAAWALGCLGGPEAVNALEGARGGERDPEVRLEVATALDEAGAR